MNYPLIAVIYNPNSTGSSKQLATDFSKRLKKRLPEQPIELIATQHAGHAEELAYELAKKYKKPLIISSSGDGGYHEVINGLMKAQHEGSRPVAGLLPAGNANDHHRNVSRGDLVDTIANEKPQKIDLLTLKSKTEGKKLYRYGHSYIGFGLTPTVAGELNKTKLTFFTQAWVVIKALFAVHPVELVINGKRKSYDSIIASNVATMSKVLKISGPSPLTDGRFEVTIFTTRHKLKLIALLIHTSVIGAKEDFRTTRFSVRTIHKTLVQIDGEIFELDPETRTVVGIEKQVLSCIV
jgi:diacylglycerol kinase family enzyme